MSRKVLLIPLFAAAFLAAPVFAPAAIGVADTATATSVKSSKSNTSDRMKLRNATTKNPGAARATTVKSSKSNTSDRMGGSGGKGTARATTVKSSTSNTSDRMGGGGIGGMGIGLGR